MVVYGKKLHRSQNQCNARTKQGHYHLLPTDHKTSCCQTLTCQLIWVSTWSKLQSATWVQPTLWLVFYAVFLCCVGLCFYGQHRLLQMVKNSKPLKIVIFCLTCRLHYFELWFSKNSQCCYNKSEQQSRLRKEQCKPIWISWKVASKPYWERRSHTNSFQWLRRWHSCVFSVI